MICLSAMQIYPCWMDTDVYQRLMTYWTETMQDDCI